MLLLEHQAKGLLARLGVPVPRGVLLADPSGPIALRPPLVVKAQVAAGGRGKAGGIRPAASEAEARAHARALLGSALLGLPVRQVLVEEAVRPVEEFYLSVLLDRGARGPLVVASASGGVGVESAEATLRLPVNPLLGLQPYVGRRVSAQLGADVTSILDRLWQCFVEYECELVEINPLALTGDGGPVALDARIVLDDRSAGRHPELGPAPDDVDPLDAAAARLAVYPVRMQGDIAVAAAGAGALMATLDYVQALGGRLAGGIDLGGVVGHRPAELTESLALTRQFAPKAFLFNFYVRTWKGDVLAEAVLGAVGDLHPRCPVVVRLAGNRAAEGHAILRAAGVPVTASLVDACRQVVEAVQQQPNGTSE
jgi:succinyl-CoA synthetase beta subunit